MNQIALRILSRMLEVLIEHTEEVRYYAANDVLPPYTLGELTPGSKALGEVLMNLRSAKTIMTSVIEGQL